MIAIVAKILTCLLVAAAIGFVTAWAMRSQAHQRRVAGLESDWGARLREQDSRLASAYESARVQRERTEVMAGQLAQATEDVKARDQTVLELQRRLDGLNKDLATARRRYEERAAELADRDRALKAALEAHHGSEHQLAEAQGQVDRQRGEIADMQERISLVEPALRRTADLEAQVTVLRTQLAVPAEATHDATALQQARERIAALEAELGQQEAAGRFFAAEIDQRDRALAEARRQTGTTGAAEVEALRQRVAELEPLTLDLSRRAARLQALEAEHGALQSRADEQAAALQGLQARVALLDDTAAGAAQRDARVAELERELAEARSSVGQTRTHADQLETSMVRLREENAAVRRDAAQARAHMESLGAQAAVLTTSMASRDARIAEMERGPAAPAGATAELEALRARVRELEPALESVRRLRAQVTDLEESLRASEAARQGSFNEATSLAARIGDLESIRGELAQARLRERQATDALERLRGGPGGGTDAGDGGTELATLRAAVHDREARLAEREREAAQLRARLESLDSLPGVLQQTEAQLADSQASWRNSTQSKDSEIARLHSQIADLRGPQSVPATVPTPGADAAEHAESYDDLKRIHGIGPVLERTLNGLGIRTFRQIATWSEADIRAFEDRLAAFRKRVERDRWVDSAREQHYLKYGEQL